MADGSTVEVPGIGHNGGPSLILPEKIRDVFFEPDGRYRTSRYKVMYGGRGGAKSWGAARVLIFLACTYKLRILCAREFQVSIADSVHRLIADQIDEMGVAHLFEVTDKSIFCLLTGSEFLFKGLRRNIREIKSLEGIDIVWVEEAQAVSKESWQILRPTIRKSRSEIWATFNPDGEEDATYQLFIPEAKRPRNAIVVKVGWQDNPWFKGTELEQERLSDLHADDPDAYQWIWEGDPRRISDAIIFRRRVHYEPFEEPTDPPPGRIFYGADWGFANDPIAAIRFYITQVENKDRPNQPDEILWITHEAFGLHVEIDDIGSRIFDRVPGMKEWPIKADNARPETISYMARRGYNITAAEKWPGSVEDGVEHMRGFKRIMVHPRCEHISREFRLYSYKVDPNNGDVLPVIVDKHNHGIDACRYGLDGIIQRRGVMQVWRKLAQ